MALVLKIVFWLALVAGFNRIANPELKDDDYKSSSAESISLCIQMSNDGDYRKIILCVEKPVKIVAHQIMIQLWFSLINTDG